MIFRDPHAPLAARVNDLYKRLTESDKLSMMTGTGFTSEPIPRLNLQGIAMADAGQGVRGGMNSTLGPATAFPASITMASSWDRRLEWEIGQAIGEEARNKGTGINMELGPAVNIHRSPLNGRDSEYISEDPYLAAHLDVPYIQGMQSTGTIACVKHFACNNEEVDRGFVNVVVDERTLREIYLPAFEAAIEKGHAGAVMAAYNRVNGPYCTANWYLLNVVLRKDWGFDGIAESDWGAVHETNGVVNAGLDLEMPGPGDLTADRLRQALASGQIKQSSIDTAVRHILNETIRAGLADPVQHVSTPRYVGSVEHQAIATKAAVEGMVLLKNQGGLLPIDPNSVVKVAIIGPRAKNWQFDAYGSPGVQPTMQINAYDGILERIAGHSGVILSYYPGGRFDSQPIPVGDLKTPDGSQNGLLGEYFDNRDLTGDPIATRVDGDIDFNWGDSNRPVGIPQFNFSARWTGNVTPTVTGLYDFTVRADDGCRLWIGDQKVIDNWVDEAATTAIGHIHLEAGQSYPLRLEYYQHTGDASVTLGWLPPSGASSIYQQAADTARKADIAIVMVGSESEGEGSDRNSLDLPDQQDELIKAVAAANKHTVVVLNNGGPVLVKSWIDKVPVVLDAGFPGETGGRALAAILFGDADPSGKLVDTYGVRREDYPDYGNFPGVNGKVVYKEGIYVGYRAFDKRHITPMFPFGYGLSYTKFKYSGIKLSTNKWNTRGRIVVSANITNVGARVGAEIAQLYVEPHSPLIDRPIRELKGFSRLDLNPGETKAATFELDQRDFAYCDVPGKQWRADPGSYTIEVGASSRDLRLSADETLTQKWTQAIPAMGMKDPNALKPSLSTFKSGASSSTKQGNLTEYAFDNDPGTRWESDWFSPQWITVDLGRPILISRVVLTWERACATEFKLQTSLDNRKWQTVYSTETGPGGVETIKFAPTKVRYVRMYGTKKNTQYGYSLYSFDVYAK
jgi:beta-glucosidase